MDYRKAGLNEIIEDAKKNGHVDALKKMAEKKIKGEKGMRNISFIELKQEYFKLYYPEAIPVAKKSKSMYEMIADL